MVEPECVCAFVHFFCTKFNVCMLVQRSTFMCLYVKISDYLFVLENIYNLAPFGCVLISFFFQRI